jgi:RimJ/RimL family protein N-acetyltransferase
VIELRDGDVLLRPFRPEEVEFLVAAKGDGMVPTDVSPERRRRTLERRVARSGRFVDGRLDLAIVAGGELVGDIEARQPKQGLPPGTFEIGIALDPAARGAGVGTRAVRLLTQYLFDELEAHRVQAGTWVENHAMRGVLERLGYTCEGVMRAFMPSERGRDDYALYGVTRDEWRAGQVSR